MERAESPARRPSSLADEVALGSCMSRNTVNGIRIAAYGALVTGGMLAILVMTVVAVGMVG